MRPRVLFVHTRFPGQFAPLARALALTGGAEVAALTTVEARTDGGQAIAGIPLRLFRPPPPLLPPGHVAATAEEAAATGVAAARAARALAGEGFRPDVVYAHAGWGAGLFLREALPGARVVKYVEWYYANEDSDADFLDPRRGLDARLLTAGLNMPLAAELAGADAAIAPTRFQAERFPPFARDRITVIPDGVDTGWFRPDPEAVFDLPDGRRLRAGDRVVTYVARGADPYRGFRPFLEALALVQAADPDVEAVVLGDRTVHYGPGAGTDAHWRETVGSVPFDPARTHFAGRVPLKRYRRLLQVSAAHVHLSVPFVPSWSLIEAMACGCLVVGSDNRPVADFVTHGETGLLAPFHDPAAIAAAVREALAGGARMAALRAAAREHVEATWSEPRAVAAHLDLLARLAGVSRAAFAVS